MPVGGAFGCQKAAVQVGRQPKTHAVCAVAARCRLAWGCRGGGGVWGGWHVCSWRGGGGCGRKKATSVGGLCSVRVFPRCRPLLAGLCFSWHPGLPQRRTDRSVSISRGPFRIALGCPVRASAAAVERPTIFCIPLPPAVPCVYPAVRAARTWGGRSMPCHPSRGACGPLGLLGCDVMDYYQTVNTSQHQLVICWRRCAL